MTPPSSSAHADPQTSEARLVLRETVVKRERSRPPYPLIPFRLLSTSETTNQGPGLIRFGRQASFEVPNAPFTVEYREVRESMAGWSVYSHMFSIGPLTWHDHGGEDTSRHDPHFRFLRPLTWAVWPRPIPGTRAAAAPWRPGTVRSLPVYAAFLDAAMRNASDVDSPYGMTHFRDLLGGRVEHPAQAPEHLPRLRRGYPELEHFSDGQLLLAWGLFAEGARPPGFRGFLPPHRTPRFLRFLIDFRPAGAPTWD